MDNNSKKIDVLLYFSSFFAIILVLLLLTSSKSISYQVDNNKGNLIREKIALKSKILNDLPVQQVPKEEPAVIANKDNNVNKENTLKDNKVDNSKVISATNNEIEKQLEAINKQIMLSVSSKNEPQVYVVRNGDNLWSIAIHCKTSIEMILKLNSLKDPNFIYPGQKLLIGQKSEETANNNIIEQNSVDNKELFNFPKRDSKKFKFTWPVIGGISSEFGVRKSPVNNKMEFHTGIDILAKVGKYFTAAEAGTVIFTGTKGGYGNTIIIQHKNGFKTLYGHCLLSLVKNGQQVERGQIIGRIGETGVTTGAHLHFEIQKYDVAIDPTTLINKRFLYY